jgi:hypothetical protein
MPTSFYLHLTGTKVAGATAYSLERLPMQREDEGDPQLKKVPI